MTTTHAAHHSTNAPAASGSNAAHAAAPQRAQAGPTAPTDLFASLLALVADAPALAADTPALTAPADAAPDDSSDDATDPLAALLAWVQPGLTPATATASTTARAAESDSTATALPGHDVPALTAETRRIDGAAERPGAIELPAAASNAAGARAAAPAWLAGALRPGHAPADKGAAPVGSDTAMRWQRGVSAEHASPVALAVRSTVALGERAAINGAAPWAAAVRESTDTEALPGASPVHGARQGSDGLAAGAPGSGTEAGSGDSAAADSGHQDHAGADTPDPATDALWRDEAAEQALDVNHWGSGALRHASVRVGEAGEQAIDIQLSLRGDEVQVAFRTDDEQARELLRQQANESLGELLQGSGMQLGGVSVGAQGQPSSGDGPGARSGQAPVAAGTTHPEPAAAPASPVRTRADGGPALDLFI